MVFTSTDIQGVYEVSLSPITDERGFFARSWCGAEFSRQGLNPHLAQCNVSFNPHQGTLRGMHHQAMPHAEAKLVRCTQGAVFDVAVDLRPDSPTYKRWFGVTLSADNRKALYIPEGCAHGFLTLTNNVEVFYQMSEFYHPASARGVRWDDPAIGVVWPAVPTLMSERDRTYPDFLGV
jgi:dTDP-4-dehydrorhamnose 3,5-epimerase